MMTAEPPRHQGIKGSRRCNASRAPSHCRSFTLMELLISMTVIVIIAGVTVLGVRAIARQAKLSNATNTVIAALDTGRAHAIRSGRPTLVAFRPTLVSPRDSRIEIVTAEWTGDGRICVMESHTRLLDRMRPVQGIAPRTLPKGIMVGGPLWFRTSATLYDDLDEVWLIPSDLARTSPTGGEPPGRSVGVLFAPDGTLRLQMPERNPPSALWIDTDGDGFQRPPDFIGSEQYPCNGSVHIDEFYNTYQPQQEPCIEPVRFLVVFDYEQAREEVDPAPHEWPNWQNNDEAWMVRGDAFTEFINANANRIHFNRYTGVVMR